MKKILLLAVILTLAPACEINYDPETRYVLKTHLEDIDGDPASGITCQLNVSNGSASDVISKGRTDANGNLILVFPKAIHSVTYTVRYGYGQDQFEPLNVYNLTDEMFTDYTFIVSERLDRVNETVLLQLNYAAASPGRVLESAIVTGIRGNEDLNLGQDDDAVENYVRVYKNQTVILEYSVFDAATGNIESLSVEIPIANENVAYSLTY